MTWSQGKRPHARDRGHPVEPLCGADGGPFKRFRPLAPCEFEPVFSALRWALFAAVLLVAGLWHQLASAQTVEYRAVGVDWPGGVASGTAGPWGSAQVAACNDSTVLAWVDADIASHPDQVANGGTYTFARSGSATYVQSGTNWCMYPLSGDHWPEYAGAVSESRTVSGGGSSTPATNEKLDELLAVLAAQQATLTAQQAAQATEGTVDFNLGTLALGALLVLVAATGYSHGRRFT